jgi:hypothetical protein
MSNRSSVASCNFGALTGMMGRLTQRWLDAQPYPDHRVSSRVRPQMRRFRPESKPSGPTPALSTQPKSL